MALNESRHASDLLRYGLEAVWPMIDGVKCAHIGEKCLSCANIACRLFPTNVLLSGLQSQSQSTIAQSVFRNPYQPAGDLAREFFCTGEESCMGPSIAHWHAEPLTGR